MVCSPSWADAPAATYDSEKKTVTWDLGTMSLEDGKTYTVSFKVRLTQQAYDDAARLASGQQATSSNIERNGDGSVTAYANSSSGNTVAYTQFMTLLELLHLMRKRIKLIVLLPLIFAIATAAFTYLALPNVYTATISMYVLSKNADSTTSDNVTYNDLNASQMLANDFAKLAQSERITSATADDLGMSRGAY